MSFTSNPLQNISYHAFKFWLSCSLICLTFCSILNATEKAPISIPLWPDGAPGATGTEAKDKPQLIIHLPEKQTTSCAIVVCPGGGYGGLAMGHEGKDIATWLNGHGIAVFICDYRHRGKGYGHPAPLQDAQRAIRIVRKSAEKYHIDPDKIGILGFSAGGHLASTASTRFDDGDPKANDPVQKVSCRPDFSILCYPVISFNKPWTHYGSQRNLLGKDASEAVINSFSNETQVTSNTPPTFLFHTHEDTAVPPQNSIEYYLALKKHNVPAELHLFQKGRHGVGLGSNIEGTSQWPALCITWMKGAGFLKS